LLFVDDRAVDYRALGVEHLGTVYESLLGFELRIAAEPTVVLKPHQALVGLRTLLTIPGAKRVRALAEMTGCELSARSRVELERARTIEDLAGALRRQLSPFAPTVVASGALVPEPTEQRRRSGSHYTPRVLTERVVNDALGPLLAALGPKPAPDQVLDLA